MIRTKKLQGGAQVKLTFTLPVDAGPDGVSVLGDFSHWNEPVPLRRRGTTLSATVLVDPGERYAFRYCRGDGTWFNDDQADTEPNGFGEMNNVIDLTAL